MYTVVGVVRIFITLPEAGSLKDKRQVVTSILTRVRRKFQVAAAEVADNDNIQSAVLAVTCVSNSAPHANSILSHCVDFVENNLLEGTMDDYELQLLYPF
jgi:uncharacterized protein